MFGRTRVHLREDCLLFASTITKSSLYVRQNDKARAHQITLLFSSIICSKLDGDDLYVCMYVCAHAVRTFVRM